MSKMADFVFCGTRPLYYPAQGAEYVSEGISKTWGLFCTYVLDIPQFPVQGKVFGQSHWERVTIQTIRRNVEVEITRNEISWYEVSKFFGNHLKVSGERPNKSSFTHTFSLHYIPGVDGPIQEYIKTILEEAGEKFTVTITSEEEPTSVPEVVYRDNSTGIVHVGPDRCNLDLTLRIKGFAILTGTPFYALGTVVFNLLKIIPTIIYLLGHIFYEYFTQKNEGHKDFTAIVWDHTKKIVYKTWCSFQNIIRTPFFALLICGGAIWAIIDPFNGMKIIGSTELHWNHRKSLFTSKECSLETLLSEGLFYLFPCMSPFGVFKVDHTGKLLDDKMYRMPEDITNFDWKKQQVQATVLDQKVDKIGCCVIPCCCA